MGGIREWEVKGEVVEVAVEAVAVIVWWFMAYGRSAKDR